MCPGWADTALTPTGVQAGARVARLQAADARGGRRGRLGGVQERGHGRGVDRPARPRAAPLRVQGRPGPALAQWQLAEPLSVNEPTAGRKRHSYASAPSVSSSTPKLVASRASLFGRTRGNVRRFLPPVPDDELPDPASEVATRRSRPAARSARSRGRARRARGRRPRRTSACQNAAYVESLPCGPDEKRGWCQYASVQRAGCAARSARSQRSCGDPAPQPPTAAQLELSATTCQSPSSKL